MNPKISVVIGAYNEEKLLPRCLDGLIKQTYPKDKFEVILIDNGSTDSTAHIGEEYGAHVSKYNHLQGVGAARKFGADKARGEIIAFTDADSIPPNDWLEKIDNYLSDPNLVCVGGPGRSDKKSIMQSVIYTLYNVFHILNHAFKKPLMWGFNMAVKKDAYREVGGINPALVASEDWDLAFRLVKKYGSQSVKYEKNLFVFTSTRKQDNLSILLRYARDGFSNYFDFVILGRPKSRPGFNVR